MAVDDTVPIPRISDQLVLLESEIRIQNIRATINEKGRSKMKRIKYAVALVAALFAVGTWLGFSVASAATTGTNLHVTSVTDHNASFAWTGTARQIQVYNASTLAQVNRDTLSPTATVYTLALPAGTSLEARLLTASGWATPIPLWTVAKAGATGPQGLAGATGTNGTVSVENHSLLAFTTVSTGGSFVTNGVEEGTVDLSAGTYLLSLSAKATPDVTTAAEVFPQFFVYDQVKNSNWDGDLFNVGSGALEPFNGTVDSSHDSYFSGAQLITLTAATTLHVYAFGYDSDYSTGSYNLDSLVLSAVSLSVG